MSYVLLLTPKTENRASRVAESLQKLLAPLYFTRTNEYGKAKLDRLLFEDLLNLCNMAINLALRFRASPSEYRFQTDFRGCDQALVEDMGYEGICPNPDDHTKHIIFCTLFGALVKKQFSPLGDGRLNILEKGHVIVKV